MSPDPFHTQIRKALQNPALRIALDNNTKRRKAAYAQAFATLPDAAAVRYQARQIRAEVIANLDVYVEQFVQRAQTNGFRVHRATTAVEAVRIFLEIARQHDARLVAKSKTMVSEEIELNHALEAAGLQVFETDLGEFIVQLRGERPAHILTPAVHLRRAEVGQTFHEKLGTPYSDDVETLTQIARATLRKVFLGADIGVSGVNFGIAETGMLCVLTNEGNGRMVTTLPKVHIALMGIERIVPTMADLATVIRVLPRASAGQKITVYTNLVRAPRQPEDPDGALERHIILLDNGRSALRHGPLEEALYCIRCGACLNACPVFREIGGHAYVGAQGQAAVYSGPIGSVISPGLFGSQAFANLAHASTLCGACREACPVGIDLPRMLLEVRAGAAQRRPVPQPAGISWSTAWGLRVFGWLASSPGRFRAAQKLAGWAGGLFAGSKGWLRLPAFTGWGYAKDFPKPAAKTFQERFARRAQHNLPIPLAHSGAVSSTASDVASQTVAAAPEAPPAPSVVERLERFEREAKALGVIVIHCKPDQLGREIVRWMQAAGQDRIWSWCPQEFPAGLLEHLRAEGITVSTQFDPEAPVGLTGALAGVAETGSILLTSGTGKPLRASLLPETHLAVLRPEQIVETLTEALKLEGVQRAATSVLISGPSRTGDIELTLTVGVHGPKRVVVFCLRDGAA